MIDDSFRREVSERLLTIDALGVANRQIKKSRSDELKKFVALELVKSSIKDQLEALISAVPDQTNCSKTMALNSSPPDNNVVKEQQPFTEVEHMSPEKQPITTAFEDVKTSSYDDDDDDTDFSFDEHGDEVEEIDHDCEKCCRPSYDDDWDSLDEYNQFTGAYVYRPNYFRSFKVQTPEDVWKAFTRPIKFNSRDLYA